MPAPAAPDQLTPDYSESWRFLQRFHQNRQFVVTGISLDKKSLPTETFGPDDDAKFLKWVAACAGTPCNLYFGVNEPLSRLTKKADETDIRAVHWLHTDIDPEDGKDLQAERARILELLRNPPDGVPLPTLILFSGGGLQAFWALAEPIVVNGERSAIDDAKRFNVWIRNAFGCADNVQNLDRIMRLPGSLNLPDAKKRAKGRTESLASVVEWHESRVYSLDQFKQADPTPKGAGDATRNSAPIEATRIGHIDELGDAVSDRCKLCIVNGFIPDDPQHFPSRSEAVFWIACELIRAGVDDGIIFGVLTDERFRISESVREQKNADQYAQRQIERAREQAIDPLLRELNDKHAVIENFGGKCVVLEEVFDKELGRSTLTNQGFDQFRNRYLNRQVIVGEKTDKNGNSTPIIKPAGHWWLEHPMRRQFDRVVFEPGKETPGSYNLWKGFGCEARPGDCSLFLNHIREIVCGGNDEHFAWFVGWMANTVQNPGEQGESAIIMQGDQGTGKSIVPNLFGQLFGRHYLEVSNPKFVVGNFNAHLRDCVLLFADEAFFAGNKQNANQLKTTITAPMLMFEGKNKDAETGRNRLHLMMASNEDWVIDADFGDRRNFVLEVRADRKGDFDYFSRMVRQFEDEGGREALLHYLLNYDLKAAGWDKRAVPKTDGLREQQAASMKWDVAAVIYMAENGLYSEAVVQSKGADHFRPEGTEHLRGQWAHLRDALQLGEGGKKFGALKFANAMRRWGFATVDPDENGTIWKAPPLPDLRAKIDAVTGRGREWPGGPDAQWGWATANLGYRAAALTEASREWSEVRQALRDQVGRNAFDRIAAAANALGRLGEEVAFR